MKNWQVYYNNGSLQLQIMSVSPLFALTHFLHLYSASMIDKPPNVGNRYQIFWISNQGGVLCNLIPVLYFLSIWPSFSGVPGVI